MFIEPAPARTFSLQESEIFLRGQRIRRWVDFNFSLDNLTNKHYFETQKD